MTETVGISNIKTPTWWMNGPDVIRSYSGDVTGTMWKVSWTKNQNTGAISGICYYHKINGGTLLKKPEDINGEVSILQIT